MKNKFLYDNRRAMVWIKAAAPTQNDVDELNFHLSVVALASVRADIDLGCK
jgi:hypothetical protein